MSLNIYLTRTKHTSYDNRKTWHTEEELVFYRNITSNLINMAKACGVYSALWESNGQTLYYITDVVKEGLFKLNDNPTYYKQFDSSNGWGVYKNFVSFVSACVEAFEEYPESTINITR